MGEIEFHGATQIVRAYNGVLLPYNASLRNVPDDELAALRDIFTVYATDAENELRRRASLQAMEIIGKEHHG